MKLGEKIKAIRKERGMILDDLAAKSNVAKATLSRIETGSAIGTVRTHMKICEGLGISFIDLYAGVDQIDKEVAVVEPKLDKAEIFTYNEKASSIILTRQISKKNMMPQLVILEIGGRTPPEENPLGTEKFLFGLEGKIEVKVGENSYALRKGGAIYFKSSPPHFLKNIGDKQAKCLSVASPAVL